MNKNSEYWDKKLPKNAEESTYIPWLEEKKLVLPRNKSEMILDLGCGNGEDTAWLLQNGYQVISVDYSDYAVEKVNQINPDNTFLFDMADADAWKQFPDNYFSIVVANLTLHYFDEKTTNLILKQIKRILKPNGKLIARVNSFDDKAFGASDGEMIEDGYFSNPERGINKRFFTLGSANQYFSKIGYVAVCPKTINYIGKQKKIVEVVAQKEPAKIFEETLIQPE